LSEPLEAKRRPRLSIDGKYSIPFTTAVMMLRGNVSLRDYTEEGLRDPAVLAMADRVSYRDDPDAILPIGGQSALSRPTVEIRTRDGRVLRAMPDGVPGDPAHPVGWDALEAKFRDCVSFSARPLDPAAADRVIEMVRDLDRLTDATEIIRHL
jgi:2-methylcitrate dehydratase PrpD